MSSITTMTAQFFKKVSSKAIIVIASFACLLLFSGSAFAATQRYDSNGSFTVPAGVVQVSVSMSGGGGGGGSLSNSGAGQNGGTTYFGTLLTATGGYGGRNGSATGGGAGGAAGGVGGSSGSAGFTNGYGGMGGNSLFGTGGAGNTSKYIKASNGNGNGAGGGGGFDGGGAGGAQAFNNTMISVTPGQVIPITIGAGGAGSTGDSAFLAAGGNGSAGFVEITYTADTTAPTATVSYSTVTPTNGNVIATITPSEVVTVTNNGGSSSYTFATNGSFTFTFADAAGNTGSVTATVSNIDTTAPVITIAPYTLTPTNQDIIVTASTNEGTLNTTTNTFTANGSFNFVATDAAGNVTTVTVTITNINKVAPIITLLGNNPETVVFGGVYIDAGATASDDIDGNITANIVTVNPVNTSIVGTYTMSYSVSDSAGNAATQVNRTVTVVDTVAPVIAILGTNPDTVVQGSVYTDAGATALDNVNGSRPVTTTGSVNTAIVGTYILTYTASDLSGNIATAARTVNVTALPDTVPPVITILGNNPESVVINTIYTDAGATAFDNVDATTTVTTTSIVNTSILGTYTVTYVSTDIALNTATSTRTVNVIPASDMTAPVITLIGVSPQTVEGGTVYTDLGATALDNIDGDITANIVASSTVNTAVVGAYMVTYNVSDSSGNSAVQVTRTVTIVDTVAPVITIIGANPITVVQGSVYADTGATALDNIDGNITANIITTNNVSTSTVGTYTVVYSVSDLAGNVASSTRTVNVIAVADTTAPVITLIGSATTSAVVNTSYTDLGATSLDNVDGDITAGIVVSNPVDIATIGTYTVLYTSTDSSGNVATTTRTVNIIAVPPVDTISPLAPIISSVNTVATTTLGATLTATWSDSTDNSGSLAGYSFVWDAIAGTNPDSIVEGQATTTTTTLPNGTWYFHLIAVDPALNVSTPTTTFGPIVINNAPVGDTTAPAGPTAVTSSTHTVSVSSATTTVSLAWDTATDDTALAGYSYIWDANASSTPDNLADTAATTLTTNLPNGSWYFHIQSADASGNISSPVIDFGPIIIATTTTDIISPVGPTAVTSSSHTVSVASLNQSVIVAWDTATDETALAGYSYIWDNAASTTLDAIPETVATTATTILPNGSWYFHIQSTDTSGNVSSPVVNFGPIVVNTNLPADMVPPTVPVATVATTSATTIGASWTASTDNSGSLAGYSFVWDTSATTNPDTIAETQSTSTAVTVPNGLWYFHLVAVDPSLNVSTPTTHVGPVKIDTTAPALTLLGATIVPVVIGNSYTDAGATALDAIDGNITASIIATSTVNTAVLGTYTVTYNVSDSSGNSATPLVRTVIVIAVPDTIAPVITIVGTNPVTVILGNSYTDLGATATDNVDGNITASIATTNSVNTAVVGAYSVGYSVSDSSGNIATSSRAVNVVDPIPFTVFASVTGNGTITPNATTTVLQGNSQSYTITPNFGYDFTSLLVDGVSVATTTSYTFTNVQANHSLSAVFTQAVGAPYFTIFASAGANGTISSMGTTTIQQGNNQVYTITPNTGYSIGTLLIDGVATTTSPSFTFSNINADHTIAVSFVDLVIPVGPTAVTSSSHTPSVISANQSVNTAWDTATDNVALAGYSYAWDMNPATSPDAIVDTVTANATTVLPYGGWYFHVVSVDTSGNASSPTIHFGPVILSDSQVLITNSTIGGTTYTLYAPTVASSTALGITGTSTITNSGLITSWNIVDTLVATSTLTQVSATSSVILNSVLTNATTTNSTITGSTITNGTIDTSTLTNVQVVGTGSTITNSTLANTTVTNAVIVNGVMTSGTIVNSSGSTVTVTVPTPLTALINYAPTASFTASASYLAVTMTDTSTDPNSASLPDSWTYSWNFGDGTTASASTATVGNNQTHTYSTAGTYTISLTIADQYGLSSTIATTITVSASVPVVVPSTSGGGGGGIVGLITGNPLIISTYSSNKQTVVPVVTPVIETPITTPVVPPVVMPVKKTPPPVVVQLVPESPAVTEEVASANAPVESVAVATTSTPISSQLATVAEFVTTNSIALAVVVLMTTLLALGYFINKRIALTALKKAASITFKPAEMKVEDFTEEIGAEDAIKEAETEETKEEDVLIR